MVKVALYIPDVMGASDTINRKAALDPPKGVATDTFLFVPPVTTALEKYPHEKIIPYVLPDLYEALHFFLAIFCNKLY